MNQINIGKFIAACRKEKGYTQVQLAEKLNITDRAVSKWETGKSMPDSSIMLELCSILDISVNELLSGERITMDIYNEKVSENLIELKRNNENHQSKSKILAVLYSITMALAILICIICDFAIFGTLTWSRITLSSIFLAWSISFPLILLGKKGIRFSLILTSVLVIPFLYLLSVLIGLNTIFRMGAVLSLIAILYLWSTYIVFYRLKERKFLAASISTLLAVPVIFIINIVLAKMIREPLVDVWDILTIFILLVLSSVFMIADTTKKKPRND